GTTAGWSMLDASETSIGSGWPRDAGPRCLVEHAAVSTGAPFRCDAGSVGGDGSRMILSVEAADSDVSVVLQEALFADIMLRYPGEVAPVTWAPWMRASWTAIVPTHP